MTVRQAIQFFEDADFVKKLDTLVQVGLGYLHLNQSMTTLSGRRAAVCEAGEQAG